MFLRALSLLVVASACSMPMMPVDAGAPPPPPPVDAGPPVSCSGPASCGAQGLTTSVCRQGLCSNDVSCGGDYECGLGERCVKSRCRFTGCTADRDCSTGKCLAETFTCVECSANTDCPRDRPVCNTARNACQACERDAQCAVPGPGRCSPSGGCVHCLENTDCPGGMVCSANNVCFGARKGEPCPEGVQCGTGLACVNLNSNRVCLPSCNLYQPVCEMGELCFRLTYESSNSLVFESQGPIGVCYRQPTGLKGPRELCERNVMGGSNCQPNLQCVPDTASTSLCRAYCSPLTSGSCVGSDKCVPFVGDFNGRRYGLCLPDTGFGATCTRDAQCRTGLSCQPYDDPSSFNRLSPICQFNLGAQEGLAPCAPRVTDAGVIAADLACRSGACRGDLGSQYFCFAACATDSDCAIGGRAGSCDTDFSFVSAFGTAGTVRGCRPGCGSAADCDRFDAGVTCSSRVVVETSTSAKLSQVCTSPQGGLGAFEPCVANSQCRSGLCQTIDARGVSRSGVCLEPCTTACSSRQADAGTWLPLECADSTLFGTRGLDGVANTTDDVTAQGRFCQGRTCQTSVDCLTDAGVDSVCAPVFERTGPAALSLRCSAKAGFRPGGQTCFSDTECVSGACGTLQSPSVGTGRVCFEACTASSTCPAATSCRVGGLSLMTARGPVTVDTCAP